MGVLLKNNAVSRLASSLAAVATSLSVTTGQGALFPSPGAGEWFPLTLVKASGALEIVRCTARSGDVFTVVRAQESTSAQAFTAGDRVELRLTLAAFADVQTLISEALRKDDNLSSLADKAVSRDNLGLKTGATTDKQESRTDVNAGRLLILGGHGLGAGVTSLAVSNLNSAVVGSFAEVNGLNSDAATNNWPVLSALDGAVGTDPVRYDVHTFGSDLYTVQRAIFTLAAPARAKGRAYIRIRINGAWQAWGLDIVDGAYGFGRTPTLLTGSDNLNNVTVFGRYSWASGSVPTNVPTKATGATTPPPVTSGTLQVFEINGSSYEQVVTDYASGETFRRTSANGTTWSVWLGEFAIIYPNGTAGAPYSLPANTRLTATNPFPGSPVIAQVEIQIAGVWAEPGWDGNTGSGALSYGVRAGQIAASDLIVVQSGTGGVGFALGAYTGGLHGGSSTATIASAPIRVKVFKGKGTL